MPRLNTQLQSSGAEFLVLANLLIQGIQAYKVYTNHPGYDVVAVNPEKNLSCRIQIKSRYATDFDGGFPVQNHDTDFLILVALNRGFRYTSKSDDSNGIRNPDIYIFPINVIRQSRKDTSGWKKVYLRNIPDYNQYKDNWLLIESFLF